MYLKRLFQTIVVIALVLLVWYASDVLLLGFAGILLAIFLRGIAGLVSRYTPLSGGWSLAVTVFFLIAVIGIFIWYFSPKVAEQVDALRGSLPQAVNRLEEQIKGYSWGERILEQIPSPETMFSQRQDVLSRVTGVFSSTFGILTDIFVILIIGLFLAANPEVYLSGARHLFPLDKRERASEVMDEIGHALRWWLIGQLISMTIIGVLTWLGLWIIGVPLSMTLGILAGLLEFIPTLGPILSFVPAVLLALLDNPMTALYVAGLYVAVQAVESYLVTPLVQQQTVSLPPALTIFSVVLMGVLLGAMGILLATPLTVVILVAVKMLYVRDTLGDKTVTDGIEKE